MAQITAEIGAELDRLAKVRGAIRLYPTWEFQNTLAAADTEG